MSRLFVTLLLVLSTILVLAGCADTVTPLPTPTPEPTADPTTTPLSIKLLEKGCDGCVRINQNFDFLYELRNNTDKDIQSFAGNVFFTDDRSGEQIKGVRLVYDGGLAAGETKRFTHFVQFDNFSETDLALRDLPKDATRLRFEIKEITFTDGTVQQFPSET